MYPSPLSFVFGPWSTTGTIQPCHIACTYRARRRRRRRRHRRLRQPRAQPSLGDSTGPHFPRHGGFCHRWYCCRSVKMVAAPIARKLLLQCQGANAQALPCLARSGSEARGVLRRVPSEQGSIRALWRGLTPDLLRYFPQQAITLACYERARTALNVQHAETFGERLVANVGAGSAAGALVLLAVHPLDLARTKLALDVGTASKRSSAASLTAWVRRRARGAGSSRGVQRPRGLGRRHGDVPRAAFRLVLEFSRHRCLRRRGLLG